MNKEKAKAAFEKWFGEYYGTSKHEGDALEEGYLAGAEWAWGEQQEKIDEHLHYIPKLKNKEQWQVEIEKLQADLDWHKKELARVDHGLVDACDRANKLQTELNDYKQGADTEGREADRLRPDLKSVNFSYWKKCEELSELQEQNQKLRECVEFYGQSKIKEEIRGAYARQCLAEIDKEKK